MRYKLISCPIQRKEGFMMKRKTIFRLLALFAAVSLWILPPAACGESLSTGTSIGEKIASIDGVASVEPIRDNLSEWLPEKYLVLVEQQLDWNNPQAGTFLQRVEVGIHPGAQVNLLETYGYTFLDGDFSADDQPEIVVLLEANHIKVEHRLAGESFPEGMNNRSTEGWEYLTTENESGDYHHVYEIMSQVLDGPWVGYGRSRGGRACSDYARHYPDDMKGYIPYVGVNPNGLHDPRLMDYVNTKIGDAAFGKEEAARRRGVMEDFLVECVKNRETLENILWGNMMENGYSFPEWTTRERLLDITLLEFQVEFWQNDGDIQEIEGLLGLPYGDTEEEKNSKISAMFAVLLKYGSPVTYSHDHFGFSYFVGALIDEGHYALDFSRLRAAQEKAGMEDELVIRPEDEEDLLKNSILDEDQKADFVFVPGHYEALDSFVKTTDVNFVFIGGDLDPWSAVYVDGGDNPHFKSYILTGKAHNTQISDFDPETQAEILETIKSWYHDEKRNCPDTRK